MRTFAVALAAAVLVVSGCSGDDGGSVVDDRPAQERLADVLIARDVEQTEGIYDADCLRELAGLLDDEQAELAITLLTTDERPEVPEETQQVLDAFGNRLFNCLPIDTGG